MVAWMSPIDDDMHRLQENLNLSGSICIATLLQQLAQLLHQGAGHFSSTILPSVMTVTSSLPTHPLPPTRCIQPLCFGWPWKAWAPHCWAEDLLLLSRLHRTGGPMTLRAHHREGSWCHYDAARSTCFFASRLIEDGDGVLLLQEDHFQAPPGSPGTGEAEGVARPAGGRGTGRHKRRSALADLPPDYPTPATRVRLCHLTCLFEVCHQNDPDPGESLCAQMFRWDLVA